MVNVNDRMNTKLDETLRQLELAAEGLRPIQWGQYRVQKEDKEMY